MSKSCLLYSGSALMISPARNTACTTGTIISDQQSSVTFPWNSATNTYSYKLVIINLLTQYKIGEVTTTSHLTEALQRNTDKPGSWYQNKKIHWIQRKAIYRSLQCRTWLIKFCTIPCGFAGTQLCSKHSCGKVDLTWRGHSVDYNIAYHGVYFGTTVALTLFKARVTDMF